MTPAQTSNPDNGWFKSSRSSNNAACVEVRIGGAAVGVRDSKDPTGPTLAFSATAWTGFLTGLHADRTGRA